MGGLLDLGKLSKIGGLLAMGKLKKSGRGYVKREN